MIFRTKYIEVVVFAFENDFQTDYSDNHTYDEKVNDDDNGGDDKENQLEWWIARKRSIIWCYTAIKSNFNT